jgi:hypothetical protein
MLSRYQGHLFNDIDTAHKSAARLWPFTPAHTWLFRGDDDDDDDEPFPKLSHLS